MSPLILISLGVLVGIGASFSGLGGGFIVVPLLILLGFTAQRAVGTSFMAILIISISALFAHSRLDHVDYRTGILIGLGGIAGALIGSKLVTQVSADTFNKVFSAILMILALRMFFQK